MPAFQSVTIFAAIVCTLFLSPLDCIIDKSSNSALSGASQGLIQFNQQDLNSSELKVQTSHINIQNDASNNSKASNETEKSNNKEINEKNMGTIPTVEEDFTEGEDDEIKDLLQYSIGRRFFKKLKGKKILKRMRYKIEKRKHANNIKTISNETILKSKTLSNKTVSDSNKLEEDKKGNEVIEKVKSKKLKNNTSKSNNFLQINNSKNFFPHEKSKRTRGAELINSSGKDQTDYALVTKNKISIPAHNTKFWEKLKSNTSEINNTPVIMKKKTSKFKQKKKQLSSNFIISQPFTTLKLIRSLEKWENDIIQSEKNSLSELNQLEYGMNLLKNKYIADENTMIFNEKEPRGLQDSDRAGEYCNSYCEQICLDSKKMVCGCFKGFKISKFNSRMCVDINECETNNGNCSHGCRNLIGSHHCTCPRGLRLDPSQTTCEDINECHLRNNHGPCQDVCSNTFGSYKCSCERLPGTTLASNGHSCELVNGCSVAGCSHKCINTPVGAFCLCPRGLQLGNDWKTCEDVNECEMNEIQSKCSVGCLNTPKSFICITNPSRNDSSYQNTFCPLLAPPNGKGLIECNRSNGSKSIDDLSNKDTLTPGTICHLNCPLPFHLTGGEHAQICDIDGQWKGPTKGKCKVYPKPNIKCPKAIKKTLSKGKTAVLVNLERPHTNLRYDHDVRVHPKEAKKLYMMLNEGVHWITFRAIHPVTHFHATCQVQVTVRASA